MSSWAFRKSWRVVFSSAHSKVHWCFSISSRDGIPNSNPLSSIKSSSIMHAPYTVFMNSMRLVGSVQSVCDVWPRYWAIRVGSLEIASSFCAVLAPFEYTSCVTDPVSCPASSFANASGTSALIRPVTTVWRKPWKTWSSLKPAFLRNLPNALDIACERLPYLSADFVGMRNVSVESSHSRSMVSNRFG